MYAQKEAVINTPFTMEKIEAFGLETMIDMMEQTFYSHFSKKEYDACEDVLHEFCYYLLDLTEIEQLFIARVHFTSIVTDIIRTFSQRGLLYSYTLSVALKTISTIETWKNISEYLLHIPWFLNKMKQLVRNFPISIQSSYVEQAISLIHHHLTGDTLTVQWLADQLEISSTHLSNSFKLEVGEPLSTYILRRKMDEIVFELTETNKSLEDIRQKYGFFNHSHFIQSFKKLQGITPLQFKQSLFN